MRVRRIVRLAFLGVVAMLGVFARCRPGTRVKLYAIEGGGHTWPGEAQLLGGRSGKVSRDIDANQVILNFFLASSANAGL